MAGITVKQARIPYPNGKSQRGFIGVRLLSDTEAEEQAEPAGPDLAEQAGLMDSYAEETCAHGAPLVTAQQVCQSCIDERISRH